MQTRRTALVLIPHSRNYDDITIEHTGFVSLIQRHVSINVLNYQIPKLLVSSKFYACSFANQLFYLLVSKRLILFRNIYIPQNRNTSSNMSFSSKAWSGRATLPSKLG